MARRVKDMVVVITGASAGIGRALAEELARRGAKLVLAARRGELLEEVNQSLGGGHLCIRADVARPGDCRRMVAGALERFGRIDTLVCNAGYGLVRSVMETSQEELEAMFRTNLLGTTECIRAAVPIMERQEPRDGWRGQVMIVSSSAARRSPAYLGVYSATKAAQLSIAEALRVELREKAIAVTSVHPIGTATDFVKTAHSLGGTRMIPRAAVDFQQSARTVARKMVRGIERPRPEVWPLGISRFALSLATLVPGLVDYVVGKVRRPA